MKKTIHTWWLLATPRYLAAVALLILNDALLKKWFPGPLTGKLSDFAGLYAFAVFVCCLRPAAARSIAAAVAVAFIFWKSPWSASTIALVNRLTPLRFGRVVDWSDLLALAVLPFAAADVLRALRRAPAIGPARRRAVPAIALVSFVSFVATGGEAVSHDFHIPPGDPLRAFTVHQPRSALKGALERCGFTVTDLPLVGEPTRHAIILDFESTTLHPARHLHANGTADERYGRTVVQLDTLSIFLQEGAGNEAAALADLRSGIFGCTLRKLIQKP